MRIAHTPWTTAWAVAARPLPTASGRGYVKTRNYPVFECRFTPPEPLRNPYVAIWRAEFVGRCVRRGLLTETRTAAMGRLRKLAADVAVHDRPPAPDFRVRP